MWISALWQTDSQRQMMKPPACSTKRSHLFVIGLLAKLLSRSLGLNLNFDTFLYTPHASFVCTAIAVKRSTWTSLLPFSGVNFRVFYFDQTVRACITQAQEVDGIATQVRLGDKDKGKKYHLSVRPSQKCVSKNSTTCSWNFLVYKYKYV